MLTYFARRVALGLITALGVLTVVFLISRLSGDPVTLMLGDGATQEDADRLRRGMGLDRPLLMQYGSYIGSVLRLDFGQSLRTGTPAIGLVLGRLPATVLLAVVSFAVGLIIAFLLGVLGELVGSNALRRSLLLGALAREAVPVFWFGLMMILIFSVKLNWFPSLGRGTWRHLVLPAATLGTLQLAMYLRLLATGFATERQKDYVRSARAGGLTRVSIVVRHMLPNILLPILTVAGLHFGALLTGTVVTETVFSWPGVGRLIVESVNTRDFPVAQAGVLVLAVIFISINLLVDLLYRVVDPRIELSTRK